MTDTDARFVGSIPEHYDRFLGPMLFEPFAVDLVNRLPRITTGRVLEVACGTGILTERLRTDLAPGVALVATDLNGPMIAYARTARLLGAGVDWRQADAQALPFDDASFDQVVCQFGLMFMPDKAQALREARRVLSSNGALAFNVWAAFEHCPVGRIADEVIGSFFPSDPPTFYQVPYGLDDEAGLRRLLADAKFEVTGMERVALEARCESAADAARGLVLGNPVLLAIEERGTAPPATIIDALAEALARAGGSAPLRLPMSALVFVARAV